MNGEYRTGDVVLGEWRLERKIGEGSYGKVFEAVRTEDYGGYESKAAIKIITVPQSQSEVESIQSEGMDAETVTNYFQGFVNDLVQEFKLMAELKGNSNIVSYEDHKVMKHENGIGWDIIIRMELLTPLLTYLKTHKMEQQEVIRLGVDICKALELCQKCNVIHRDIKPENIFISKMGDFKLGDFGIARTVEKTTGGLSKKGTYTYMAPEVYREKPYGFSVDTYSLGIVIYRMLNGNRTPFLPPAATYNDREKALALRLKGEPIPAPENAEEELAQVVLKACAYDPENRFESPAHMRLELEKYLDKTWGVAPAPAPTPAPAPISDPTPDPDPDLTYIMPPEDDPEPTPRPTPPPPAPEPPKPEPEPEKKGKKGMIPLLAGAAALVVIGGIAIGTMGGSDDAPPKQESTSQNTPVVLPGEEASDDEPVVLEMEWSEWVEELPEFVNSAEYVMETKKMYQSAPAVIISEKNPDVGELYATGSGDFGEWSQWQNQKVEESKDVEVEKKVSYQYRDLLSKTVYKEDKSIVGGRVTTTSYYWDNWINANGPVKASKSREVRTFTKYRYRNRLMLYYYAPQDGWSEPTETPIYPDEENAVRTYNLYRYMPRVENQESVGSMDHFTQVQLDAEIRFADVPETQWYSPAKNSSIVHALNLKIMDTTEHMCFRPEENITVGELIRAAAIIHRTYYGLPAQFAEDENWAEAYADYAEENKIINKKMFTDMDKPADRQQTAYILYAALPEAELLPINTVKTITDMDKASLYYERVYRFAQAGIVAWPSPEYEFNPDQLVTRAEVAAMVNALVHQELRSGT